jgi:UTP--glucose-1-phosphate uridylyltransferase
MNSAKVRKAVIPAAGFGTRMLPAAKAVAKELLPVLDRPVIQYVVEEAAAAGVGEVVLVTARGKGAIEGHFQKNAELEERLAATGKGELLASVQRLIEAVRVTSVLQAEQRGLGDAVLCAAEAVGDEPFVCLLGDTIFSGAGPTAQLVAAYGQYGTSVIGLEEVPAEKVSRYGIVGGDRVADGVYRLNTLVEKPKAEEAPSRLAIAARYVLTPTVFDCLAKTRPGKGGEIQLTDGLKMLLEREAIHGVVLSGKRHDIGNPVDWLKTNLYLAARDEKLWAQIAPLVKELAERIV